MPKLLHAEALPGDLEPLSGRVWTDGSEEALTGTRAGLGRLGPVILSALEQPDDFPVTIRARGSGSLAKLAPDASIEGGCGSKSVEGCYVAEIPAILVAVNTEWMSQDEQDDEAAIALAHEVGHWISDTWADPQHWSVADEKWFRTMICDLPKDVERSFVERGYDKEQVPEELFAELVAMQTSARAQGLTGDDRYWYVGNRITPRGVDYDTAVRVGEAVDPFLNKLERRLAHRIDARIAAEAKIRASGKKASGDLAPLFDLDPTAARRRNRVAVTMTHVQGGATFAEATARELSLAGARRAGTHRVAGR